ncbi:MAG: alpha/beta hydrolase [Acidobacteriota bacterium]
MSILFAVSAAGQTKEKSVVPSEPCTASSGLHCEIYGKGDPILCLHGLGASTYSWRELKEPLSQEHQVILIDFRGFGASPKPQDKHYSIQEHADLIYQFILEHDLKNLTLMGNSFGGAVSLLVAIRLCEQDRGRFSKLILIDSGGYKKHFPSYLKLLRTPVLGWLGIHLMSSKAAARMVLKKSYYDRRKITKDQITEYAKPIGEKGGRHALLETAKQIVPPRINEIIAKYRKISVPTLILWGDHDRVIPLEIGEMLDEAIPDSRLKLIEQTGHVPQEETPDKIIPLILNFLRSRGSHN